MKTDRLLTLVALLVMGVLCSLTFINSREKQVINREKTSGWSPGFTTNYASAYLGATLTDFSRACKGASAVLTEEREKYMICSCDAARKSFTVQLIREIEVRIITLVNLEHFSASVRNFTLLGSKKYPTNEWRVLGNFEASPLRGTQHFDIISQEPVRFIRFLWVTSYSEDSWCTLTTFKTFGVDVLETLAEDYNSEDVIEESTSSSSSSTNQYQPLDQALSELLQVTGKVSNSDKQEMGIKIDKTNKQELHSEETILTSTKIVNQVNEKEEEKENNNNNNNNKSKDAAGALVKLNDIVENTISGSKNDFTISTTTNNNNNNNKKKKNSIILDSFNYCDYENEVGNSSTICLPYEKNIIEARSNCVCLAKSFTSNKIIHPPKSFQGGTGLQILTQMNKQLKLLQQELEDSQRQKLELQKRLELAESTLRLIGTHLRDTLRITSDNRDKLHDTMKEMEVMRSRLSLRLETGNNSSRSLILWVWVICSNLLALVSLIAACFAARPNLPMGASRFSLMASPR